MRDYVKMDHKKFEKLIFRRFKSMYRQHKLDMSQTCMCWGLSHGNGWHNLIWKLSEDIKRELKNDPDTKRRYHVMKEIATSTSEDTDKYGRFKYETVFKARFLAVAKLYAFFARKFSADYTPPTYEVCDRAFAVVQVKEKFGTLRYYTQGYYNDKIERLIGEAEKKSEQVCESCGRDTGESNLKGGSWVYNMCDECWHKFKTEREGKKNGSKTGKKRKG